MNIKEVRKVVASLQNSLFKNSNSYAIGMLKSHFKGTGLQFKEHQLYVHGDDVRFIDWKMVAKTSKPYIKTFEEERNIEIAVVIDASPYMFYGIDGVSKLQAAIEICCLLYLLVESTNDYVHATILADKVYDIPKLSGEKGIVALISALEKMGAINSDGKIIKPENFSLRDKNLFGSMMKHLSRKREIVILSDMNDFLEEGEVKRLMKYANVHFFKLSSPLDRTNKLDFRLFSNIGNSIGMTERGPIQEEFSKSSRIKELKIEERYLDVFVKEMM